MLGKEMFGKELVLDITDCNASKFNREDIEKYLIELCDNVIDMEREDLHWWDYTDDPEGYNKAPAHLKGTSVCQFIKTSNIVMHTLDDMKNIHLNIFSCKDFDTVKAVDFTVEYFDGEVVSQLVVPRVNSPKVEILQMKGYNFLWVNEHLWMWDIPIEQKVQRGIADKAYGDVLCAGYGLGLVQKYLLENPKVKSVTTVEKYKQVIDENLKVFNKIHGGVVVEDFFKYTGEQQYDCIIGDICDDIMPDYLQDYKVFKQRTMDLLKPDGKMFQWGGEYFEYLLEKEAGAA